MTGGPLLLDLGAEVAGHLWVAIQRHKREARRSGMQVPAELDQLATSLAARAMRGQQGTPVADLWQVTQADPVPRLLITYGEAAAAMATSVRTIKRLVAAGDIPTVHVSPGVARIRTADLDQYIAGLTERNLAC